MRRYKGKSGQIWCELSRTDTHIIIQPDYCYDDGATVKGNMVLTVAMFNSLGMKEEPDGEPEEPPTNPIEAFVRFQESSYGRGRRGKWPDE